MHFFMQALSDALLSELAGLRLYIIDHVDLRAQNSQYIKAIPTELFNPQYKGCIIKS